MQFSGCSPVNLLCFVLCCYLHRPQQWSSRTATATAISTACSCWTSLTTIRTTTGRHNCAMSAVLLVLSIRLSYILSFVSRDVVIAASLIAAFDSRNQLLL